MIVLADTLERVESRFGPLGASAAGLAERFWPGPLTLLLPDPAALAAGADGKIGIRIPDAPWLREWVRASGRFLVSTSANAAGEPPMTDALTVRETWFDRVDLLVLGPSFPSPPIPSTIVDVTVDPPRIVRAGSLSPGLSARDDS